MAKSNINALVIATLKVCATFAQRVNDLREALPAEALADRDLLTRTLRPGVAKFHGVEWAEHGKTGKFVGDDTGAARQDLSRLCRAIMGSSNKHTREEVEIPEELLVAARKLAKLAQRYEGARSLASKAVAAAFAE